MKLLLVRELIGEAQENDEFIELETATNTYAIAPHVPVEYRGGAVMVEDYAIDTNHIISVKRLKQ